MCMKTCLFNEQHDFAWAASVDSNRQSQCSERGLGTASSSDTNTTSSPEAAHFLSFQISSRRGPALSAQTGQQSAAVLPGGDLWLPSANHLSEWNWGWCGGLTSHFHHDQAEVRTQPTSGAWRLRLIIYLFATVTSGVVKVIHRYWPFDQEERSQITTKSSQRYVAVCFLWHKNHFFHVKLGLKCFSKQVHTFFL